MGLFRRSPVERVSASDLVAHMRDGAEVVDVRTPEELAKVRLDGARHIPMDQLSARAHELDPERLTIFLCRSGQRSMVAANALARHGYRTANLTGGVIACKRAGVPLVMGGPSA